MTMTYVLLYIFIGGPYAAFGGKDASRGLATFSVTANDNNDYDDLSDLSPAEMESVKEWEMQFKGTKFMFSDMLITINIGIFFVHYRKV